MSCLNISFFQNMQKWDYVDQGIINLKGTIPCVVYLLCPLKSPTAESFNLGKHIHIDPIHADYT